MKRRKRTSPAPAVRAHENKTGRVVALITGELDRHGELELKLEVDGRLGSVWISQEFWEAIGEKVGWIGEETRRVLTPSKRRR